MAYNSKFVIFSISFCLLNAEAKLPQLSLKALEVSERRIFKEDIANELPGGGIIPQYGIVKVHDSENQFKKLHSELDRVLKISNNRMEKEFFDDNKRQKTEEQTNHIPPFSLPFQGCSNASYPESASGKIKTFKINLDDQPDDRWKDVAKYKKNEMTNLVNFIVKKYGKKLTSIVDKYLSWIHGMLPEEFMLELNGIAQWSGISVGEVTLFNIFYEFSSMCTSIVAEGEDGRIYHARNLDFGMFMGWDPEHHTWFLTEILRPLIIKLEFFKNGKPLYSAVTYAGYTGILTGLKKNKFSLTINERFRLDGGYVGLVEWLLGRRDLSWLGLLTRQVLESADSYYQAQQMLETKRLVAPVYFILAGNCSGQGSIITRGRRDADVWKLGSRHPGQNGSWFLVETNYDHWKRTPFFDQRRRYAVQCMDQLGRSRPLDTLYKVLSTKPVLNKETTLTALMDVTAGHLQVWERECEDPCWPF